VEKAFTDFDVVGFYADVEEWESYIDIWEEDFGGDLCVQSNSHHAIAFDMRQRKRDSTMAIEALYDAVIERQVTHDGDPRVSQYVYNAKRRPNNFGVSIAKENQQSDKKIDFAITAALARKARQDYLALPENKKRRKRGISLYMPEDE
jgi:phage terminase large subunit-like protein